MNDVNEKRKNGESETHSLTPTTTHPPTTVSIKQLYSNVIIHFTSRYSLQQLSDIASFLTLTAQAI